MDIIYVKYSRERKNEFKIKTTIFENKSTNERVVKKEALSECGNQHIASIISNYELLNCNNSSSRIEYVKYNEYHDGGIRFPYIYGERLSDIVVKLLKSKKFLEARTIIQEYFEEIKKSNKEILFNASEPFKSIFGNAEVLKGDSAFAIANLDCILDNVIIQNGTFKIIDYEWVFPFSIPTAFIGYRILNSIPYLKDFYQDILDELYRFMNIKKEHTKIYENMDNKLQEYICGNCVKLQTLHDDMHMPVIALNQLAEIRTYYFRKLIIKYNGAGEVIREERILPNNGLATYTFEHIKECEINFTPLDCPCIIKLEKISYDFDNCENTISTLQSNAKFHQNEYYYFDTIPKITFETYGLENLKIQYVVLVYDNPLIKSIINEIQEKNMIINKYDSIYNTYLSEINQKNKEIEDISNKKNSEILMLGDKVSELVKIIGEKNDEVSRHVEFIKKQNLELIEHVELINSTRCELDNLSKKLNYMVTEKPIKAIKYLRELRKEKNYE